jgi:hypothetical protein
MCSTPKVCTIGANGGKFRAQTQYHHTVQSSSAIPSHCHNECSQLQGTSSTAWTLKYGHKPATSRGEIPRLIPHLHIVYWNQGVLNACLVSFWLCSQTVHGQELVRALLTPVQPTDAVDTMTLTSLRSEDSALMQ